MINPAMIMKLKQAKDVFVANHPKFPLFLRAVRQESVHLAL